MNDLPLKNIKGVGEKTEKLFRKLDIMSVHDLVYYFPRDYETYESLKPISQLIVGNVEAVLGTVVSSPVVKKIRNLTIITAIIKDATGTMQITFFNMQYLRNVLKIGSRFVFRQRVQSRNNNLLMEQPKMLTLDEYQQLCGVLQPQYSLTKGLTNHMIQKTMRAALDLACFDEEYYPDFVLEKFDYVSEKQAVEDMHFPKNRTDMIRGRKRLVFDEFFAFMMLLRRNKSISEALPNHYVMYETKETREFLEHLPFQLTRGQKKVWQELRNDFSSNVCMNRLVQGDVGSGKTIVAELALLECVANGYQGALMAPTEVLAKQHYDSFVQHVTEYNIPFVPVLLVGSMTAKEKRLAYEKIESGEANLVIGTHALIQEKVHFKQLALVVCDEQHRFGVRQRENLIEKGIAPHVLVMSATPIPRTLAIIMYGDLDISIIDELPANRLPIKNCVVNTGFRNKAYEFISKEVENGRQAYVICSQVEAGENEDLENVVDYADKLKSVLPSSVRVAYLHGKMRSSEKNEIMENFANHNIDVLVSTTVIEVGINVPNATVMMVENAERFGLAQLHQLRGRVGRGEHQSYCIFVSTNENKDTMERLEILNHSNDGFFIASEDLKLRGPGEMFGVRQSGELSFVLGDIYTDASILKEASEAVAMILNEDPLLEKNENKQLKEHFQHYIVNSVDFRTI